MNLVCSNLAARVRAATGALLHWEHSDRKIVQGMAWTVMFMLRAKAVAVVKEIVVARRFGVGTEVDAYLLVISVIGWPIAVADLILMATLP